MNSQMIHDNQKTESFTWKMWLGVIVIALITGAVSIVNPVIAFGLILAVVGGLILFKNPAMAVPFVLFVIYSNIAVVAVKFHGVPAIMGKAVPGMLGIPLFYYLFIRKRGLIIGPSFVWMILFGITQLAGVLFANRPELAWESFNTYFQEGLILYFLFTNVIRTKEILRASVWGLLLAGCIMGGVPLLQQVTGTFTSEYGGLAQTGGEPGFNAETGNGKVLQQRLSGPIGEKNRYAQIMLMLIPLGLYQFKNEKNIPLKTLAGLATFLAMMGAYLAFSRSTILVVGFTIGFAAWMGFVNQKRVFLLGLLGLILLLLTPQYRTRMATLVNLKDLMISGQHSSADGALKGRATEMGAAALVFLDHPIVGVGPGMFKYYSQEYGERIGFRALKKERQAHCLVLDVAAENGLLGLTCLLAIFWIVVVNLLRTIKQLGDSSTYLTNMATAFSLVIVIYFGTGIFLHFAFIRYFWVMIALADCVTMIASKEIQANNNSESVSSTAGLVTSQGVN